MAGVKLIASSPKLDIALKNLIAGIGKNNSGPAVVSKPTIEQVFYPPPQQLQRITQYHIVNGYNATEDIDATPYDMGHPVELIDYDYENELFEIQPVTSDSTGYWGILRDGISSQSTGRVILSGVTTVYLSDTVEVGDMVMPDVDNIGKFCAGGDRALVLATDDNNLTAIVMLSPISSAPVSTSGDVVVCEITGGNAQLGYNVNIFGNGPQNAYTGTGKLYATEIAYGSTLPTGARIIGHKVAMTITGGTA